MFHPLLPSRLVGLLVGLLLSATVAHSQDVTATSPAFTLGVRAGYSTYTLEGKEVELLTQPQGNSLQRSQWFTLGGVLRQRVYKPLAVQAEVSYVREGGDFKRAGFPGKTVYTIDCLHIPLLLDVQVPLTPTNLSLHLQGGAALVLVMRGVELDTPSFAPQNSFDNQTSFFAAAGGAEMAWQQGRRSYFLNLRYTQDLTDYYRREYYGTHYYARSNGFQLTAGLLMGLPVK